MEIIFIRHAQKESLGEDPYLTTKGIKQANRLAKRLKKEKISEFYCSNLNRAKHTAKIISKKIKLKPKIEKSLNEFESKTIKTEKEKWNSKEKKHYKELISFLKLITKNPNKDKTILIVAHGITNRIILSFFLGVNMLNIVQFIQNETCVNSIYWMEKFKNWRLRRWNDNHHVPLKLR